MTERLPINKKMILALQKLDLIILFEETL